MIIAVKINCDDHSSLSYVVVLADCRAVLLLLLCFLVRLNIVMDDPVVAR